MFSASLDIQLFSEREIITDRILYACSDRVPHLKESVKDYVLGTSIKMLQPNNQFKTPKWDHIEKIYEEVLIDLIDRKMIFESPRTGRFFTNDWKLQDWEFESIDKESDSRDRYFQKEEERLHHIDYVPLKRKHRTVTDLLQEDKKQMIVLGGEREFVTIVEVVDEDIFFARNKNNVILPYCFTHLEWVDLKEL